MALHGAQHYRVELRGLFFIKYSGDIKECHVARVSGPVLIAITLVENFSAQCNRIFTPGDILTILLNATGNYFIRLNRTSRSPGSSNFENKRCFTDSSWTRWKVHKSTDAWISWQMTGPRCNIVRDYEWELKISCWESTWGITNTSRECCSLLSPVSRRCS